MVNVIKTTRYLCAAIGIHNLYMHQGGIFLEYYHNYDNIPSKLPTVSFQSTHPAALKCGAQVHR